MPNRLLYYGGHGIYSGEKYSDKFDIVDMIEYDIELLEKNSYGLERTYPRYCPNFSINTIETIIRKYLNLIQQSITFEIINPDHPLLGSVIKTSIGSPSAEKIAQVLQNYNQRNQLLIRAFLSKNLIAVIGFELKGTQAIIKHISVSDDFKKHSIGNCLIQKVNKDHVLSSILLENALTSGSAFNFCKLSRSFSVNKRNDRRLVSILMSIFAASHIAICQDLF